MGAAERNHCNPLLSGRGVCIHQVPLVEHCERCKQERIPPPKTDVVHEQTAK